MPNQNTQNPNPNQPIDGLNEAPFMPQSDIPPLPPEMTNPVTPPLPSTAVPTTAPEPEPTITTTPIVPATDSGSASPTPAFSDITAPPKKKFGGGKIIATILGILVLVGGLGAGTYLIGQKQLFQQKASSDLCSNTCATDGAKSCVTVNGKNNGRQCTCTNIGDFWCCNGTSCNSTAPGATRYKNVWQCAINTTDCPIPPPNQTSPPQQPKTGWGIGKACKNNPSTTGDHCIIIRCPNGCVDGCSENDPGATFQSGSCDTLAGQVTSICGQVDLVNASGVYCESDGTFTDAQINCPQPKCAITSNPTNPPIITPTSSPVAPYCAAIHVYDAEWNVISTADLSKLVAGATINFCVSGAAPSGTFDMARFTINGVQQTDTTTRWPGSTDFCQSYTLPEGTSTFTVSAQIHHSTEGWI